MTVVDEVLAELQALANPKRRAEHFRVAVGNETSLGVSVPDLRRLARRHRDDHDLAAALWASGVHEARQLAAMVEDPAKVTRAQAEAWTAEFDSWDVCDGVCVLYARLPYAWELARAWADREPEFTRRAAFALIAYLAIHDRAAVDQQFLALLPVLRMAATDDRNFVKKAVNWALRQIGKRNSVLNAAAIACAEEIQRDGTRSGRWIAADALRELRSEAVQARLLRPRDPPRV